MQKPKIIDPCELGDTNNVSLTSEILCSNKRGNFKAVISSPVFMTDSVDLINHLIKSRKRWLKLLRSFKIFRLKSVASSMLDK